MEEDKEKSKADRKGLKKKTVLNLSSLRLSDDDFILLGKGLSFCPKTKCHDKIKVAEELFKYTCRLCLKFFFESDQNKDTPEKEDTYSELPFFNKNSRHSRLLVVETYSYLVTLNVSFLYTNIPHVWTHVGFFFLVIHVPCINCPLLAF